MAIDWAATALEALHFGLIATDSLGEPEAGPVEKALIVVTAHCPACGPATFAPLATATPWPAAYQDAWNTYSDAARGFEFDYPAFYDAQSGCGLTPDPWPENPASVLVFGSENTLSILPANGLALEAYVDQAIAALGFEPRHYHGKRALETGQTPGFVVDSVLAHHAVTWVYFQREDEIFEFFARHNLGCMAPEFGVENPTVFYRIAESFRFVP